MAEAKLNREYAKSRFLVGAMMFGICVWSIYDGMKGWPRANARMDEVRPLLLATNMTVTAWLERDDTGVPAVERFFAEAAGRKAPGKLSTKIKDLRLSEKLANDTPSLERQAKDLQKVLEEPLYSAHDIETQWLQAAVAAALGVLLFVLVGLKASKRFVADERGLSGNGFGPQPIVYEDIEEIDWKRWDEKGIVVLTLKSGRRIKLDGWHFAGITGISEEIRKHRPDLAPKNETGNEP
ncbi:MAG: hypothetical protein FWG50_08020 [Kiritimatiellaeota bacterium]|nr:hypothetical protein [Kiritimatiellota bacterium]